MNVVQSFIDRLDYPVSARPFAVFRIGFGLVLAAEYLDLLYFRGLLAWNRSPMWQPLLLVLSCVGVLCATALSTGVFYRASAIASYLCAIATFGVALPYLDAMYAGDSFLIIGTLVCLLCPANRSLVSNLCNVLVIVILSTIYLDAFIGKMSDDVWLSGLGVWLPMTQPFAKLFDFEWLTESESIARSMGYAALAYQGLFPFLIWFKRLRLPLVLTGIGMHLGIGLSFPIPLFGIVVTLFYLPLIPPWVYQKLGIETPATNPVATRHFGDRRPILACIALFIITFPMINSLSEFHTRFWFSSDSTPIGRAERKVRELICLPLKAVYPFTGIINHALFMKHHWVRHPTEYRLVFANDQDTMDIPLMRESGFAGAYTLNRRWCVFSWYAYSPEPHKMLRTFEAVAEFWSRRSGVDLSSGEVQVYARNPTIPFSEWRPGVLRENRDRPWQLISRLALKDGTWFELSTGPR